LTPSLCADATGCEDIGCALAIQGSSSPNLAHTPEDAGAFGMTDATFTLAGMTLAAAWNRNVESMVEGFKQDFKVAEKTLTFGSKGVTQQVDFHDDFREVSKTLIAPISKGDIDNVNTNAAGSVFSYNSASLSMDDIVLTDLKKVQANKQRKRHTLMIPLISTHMKLSANLECRQELKKSALFLPSCPPVGGDLTTAAAPFNNSDTLLFALLFPQLQTF